VHRVISPHSLICMSLSLCVSYRYVCDFLSIISNLSGTQKDTYVNLCVHVQILIYICLPIIIYMCVCIICRYIYIYWTYVYSMHTYVHTYMVKYLCTHLCIFVRICACVFKCSFIRGISTYSYWKIHTYVLTNNFDTCTHMNLEIWYYLMYQYRLVRLCRFA